MESTVTLREKWRWERVARRHKLTERENSRLVEESLSLGRETPQAKLHRLQLWYDFVDFYCRLIVAPAAVCKKKCSFCCHFPIDVSSLEAVYITKKTGIAHRQPTKQPLVRAGPCPLLTAEGTCSIYQARPLVCRGFYAHEDPRLCESGKDQLATSIGGSYDHPTNTYLATAKRVIRFLDGEVFDIREFFGSQS